MHLLSSEISLNRASDIGLSHNCRILQYFSKAPHKKQSMLDNEKNLRVNSTTAEAEDLEPFFKGM